MTAKAEVGRGFVERSWTSVDGLALCARDYAGAAGAARLPVICLHGLTRNARDFEDFAPRVAATGRRVLAVDVRGRGRSAWDAQPMRYVAATYVADVLALAQAAGVARAIFVGTSMGGLITLGLAAAPGPLIAAAVLNDIGPVLAPEGLARISAYTGSLPEIHDWDAATAYVARINGPAFPHYGPADWAAFARRLFRDEAGRPVADYDPAIAVPIRAAGAVPPPDLWPLFDALALGRPLLVVRGELSDLLTADTAAAMRGRAQDLRVVEAQGVGHAPMLDEADVAPAVFAFLDSVA